MVPLEGEVLLKVVAYGSGVFRVNWAAEEGAVFSVIHTVIGGIVVAMYLPIFKLGQVV